MNWRLRNNLKKKIPGFTLAEMLVTLVLTALLTTFSYKGLGYVQKLFFNYGEESVFITQLNTLYKRIEAIEMKNNMLIKQGNKFVQLNDTLNDFLQINDNYILVNHLNKADTFKMECRNIHVTECNLQNLGNLFRPVEKIQWEVLFRKQSFTITLNKEYDARTRFNYESSIKEHAGN